MFLSAVGLLLCSWAAQTAWRVLVSASYWSKLVCRAWNKSVRLPPCSSAFLCTMQIIERGGLAIADKNCKYLVHLSCIAFLRKQHINDAISYYMKSLYVYFIQHLLIQLTIWIWHFMIQYTPFNISYHITTHINFKLHMRFGYGSCMIAHFDTV